MIRLVDMLDLMTADDPPIWMKSSGPASFPATEGNLLHHPFHARDLKDRADEVGIENVVYLPALDINDPSDESQMDFLLRHLGK